MSHLHLPVNHAINYPPARGHVLLLSCMDPRLLDDTVHFMNHDNLCNRYDHVVMAGAALGALGGDSKDHTHWKKTFFDHLAGAYELHDIQEVYIVEHRGCGAYSKIFKVAPDFGDSPKELDQEAACHFKYARQLQHEIEDWAKGEGILLKVKTFLMDLRGRVSLLTRPSKKGLNN